LRRKPCTVLVQGKHRRDNTDHNPLAEDPQGAAGTRKENSDGTTEHPATAKEGYVPHGCKQYDFPSGPWNHLDIRNMQALNP